MIDSAPIDWDNVPECVKHFGIKVSQKGYWPCEPWCAYSATFGPEVGTVYAPTRDEAIHELIDWLQGYVERRYGPMHDEAGFIRD